MWLRSDGRLILYSLVLLRIIVFVRAQLAGISDLCRVIFPGRDVRNIPVKGNIKAGAIITNKERALIHKTR